VAQPRPCLSTAKREIVGRAPGTAEERNLSWADWSFPVVLSDDGHLVVFEEQNLAVGDGSYALFIRPTDGAAATRLGGGAPSICRRTAGGSSPSRGWASATSS